MDKNQRLRILSRDGYRCRIQGPRCTSLATEVDHIEARGAGGRHGLAKAWNDRDENLRGVCKTCHTERHSGGRVYV